MKQIQFANFGPPSQVVQCVDVADVGSPSAWEVVVNIEAFPINVADLAILAGRYGSLPKLPSTIGMEAAGIVTACGSSIDKLAEGDRVVLLANNNWTQRRKVPLAAVHKVPADSDPQQMCMLKVNPATALTLVQQLVQPRPDDWIVQNAPLSSVGSCVIQIAKALGFRTINIVRRTETIAKVMRLGGDVALEDGPDLAARIRSIVKQAPLKLALDAVAGPGVQWLAESLSEGATIVNYGMLSGEAAVLCPEQTVFRGITLRGFWLSKMLNRLSLAERDNLFGTLTEFYQQKKLNIAVDSCYSISEIAAALARAEQSHRNGKVLVLPQSHGLEPK